MPASIAIAIVATVFIVALKLKCPIGLAFLGCALLLGVFSGMAVIDILARLLRSLFSLETFKLVGIVYLLGLTGIVLSELGWLSITVASLKRLIPSAKVSAVIPASMIGLLPMPGGAMLSAPLVAEGAKEFDITPEKLTFLNFWFRHLWEYVWPLYPGIVISSALFEMPPGRLIAAMWPMSVAAIISGVIFGFTNMKAAGNPERPKLGLSKALVGLLKTTWYIWAVVIFVLALKIEILPVVAISVLVMLFILKRGPRDKLVLFKRAFWWKTITLLAGVMVFKGMLEAGGLLTLLAEELSVVPDELLLFAIPFGIGLLTGVNAAYVGLGFPLLFPFLLQGGFDPGNFAFAYASGFIGVLLSPVHLCLSLTKQYFDANWSGIYRLLIPTAGCTFIMAILLLVIV